MERLDQGHLHPKLEVPGLTCPGRDSNSGLLRGMRALEKSHPDSLLISIQNFFLHMNLRQFHIKLKLFQVDIDANGDEVKYTEVSWLDLVAKEAARLRQVKGIIQLFYIRQVKGIVQLFYTSSVHKAAGDWRCSAWIGNRYLFIIKGRIRIRSSIFYKKCLVSDPDS